MLHDGRQIGNFLNLDNPGWGGLVPIGVDAFENRPHSGGNGAFDIRIETVTDKQNPAWFNTDLPCGIQKNARVGLAIGKIAGIKLDRKILQNAYLSQMPLEAVFVDKRIGHNAEFQAHRVVGRRVAEVADALITVGRRARVIGREALGAGLSGAQVHMVDDAPESVGLLEELIRPGDVILIKGSLGMRMDRIVTALGRIA